jgi:F420-non-reducing hydrogenase small subunit
MPDGHIDVCLFNGAIRTSENEHMAHLLRQKSSVLVAFGSCANEGCIPGLANLFDRQSIFERAYLEVPSVDNPGCVLPQTSYQLPEGEVTIPKFYNTVKTLRQVEDVDYFVPGCPPQAPQIWAVIEAILGGNLPPKGSVVGANEKTVCDECKHTREEKRIKKFYRIHEIIPDSTKCLLDQGIICAGPATRGGCGALCTKVDMPCRGCYGPPPNVIDQGAALLSAVASVVDADTEEEAARIVGEIADPVGTFYRFGLPASLLHRSRLDIGY